MHLNFRCESCGRTIHITYAMAGPPIPNELPSSRESTHIRMATCWCASEEFKLRLRAGSALTVERCGPMIRLGKIVSQPGTRPIPEESCNIPDSGCGPAASSSDSEWSARRWVIVGELLERTPVSISERITVGDGEVILDMVEQLVDETMAPGEQLTMRKAATLQTEFAHRLNTLSLEGLKL